MLRNFHKKAFIIIFLLLISLNISFGGEQVIKNVLGNRLTIIFKETKGLGIISGTIFIKGGSIEDPKGKKGLTTLTLMMLLKGSKNYNSYELNKVFEDSGGYISASTYEEFVTIDFALRTEDFDKGMKVIKDMIFNPTFPKEQLEIEKRNLISAIKAKKEDGFSYAYDELRKEMYKDTPYQTSPLGEIEDVKSITVEDLRKRWKEIMEGSRWIVSIVGDLPYNSVEPDLKDSFSQIPSEKIYQYPVYIYKLPKGDCKRLKREGAQSTILLAYNAPDVKERYYFATRVLNGILGSGFTSRLFQEVREKRGLAYAVGSFYPTRINMGRLIAYIGTAPQNTDKAVSEMRKVIENIKNGVSSNEIKTAKEKIIGSFLLNHQTRAKQSWYLGWFETMGLGYEMDSKYTEYINRVSSSDILESWDKYLSKGNVCVIVSP